MSYSFNSLPAHHAPSEALASSLGGLVARAWDAFTDRVRAALELRRNLSELANLSDRELSDVGLGSDEIQRLRRGDVFTPQGWKGGDVARDQLPI